MNLTLAIDEEVLLEVRRRAEVLGTSVNQLVRDYLEQFAGSSSRHEAAKEFLRLSLASKVDSGGWKFNRDELHER